MSHWPTGSAAIEQMIDEGRLERVPASRPQADFLISQARTHAAAAASITDLDPAGAYQLTYDGARKALVAVLQNQGLRPTRTGGHVAVYDAVSAQLDRALGQIIRPFNRMRRTRNDSEYPSGDAPAVTADDVTADMGKANDIIDMASRLLDQMDPF